MKRTKRFLSLILSMILLASMAMPVMAEDNYEIVISDKYDNHVYEAYQIFGGTYDEATHVLTDIIWGSNFDVANIGLFLAALQEGDQFGNSFDNIQYVSGKENDVAEAIADVMEGWKAQSDDDRTKLFASILHNKDVDASGNPSDTDQDGNSGEYLFLKGIPKESAKTSEGNNKWNYTIIIPKSDTGYYLIKDKDGTQDANPGNSEEKHDFYTRLMLQVVGNVNISPKGDVPTVSKSVHTAVDGNYSEAVSSAIDNVVYFRLEGTLPSNLKDYETYSYKFVDTLSAGLDLVDTANLKNNIAEAYILHENGTEVNLLTDEIFDDPNRVALSYVENATDPNATSQFTIEFKNIINSINVFLAQDKIVVKYKAKLNENAIMGTGTSVNDNASVMNNTIIIGDSGNENTVYLEYSNNPQGDGIGRTPEDDARVYSFQMDLNKRDESDKNLSGAEFLVYHRVSETGKSTEYDYYYAVFKKELDAEGKVSSYVLDQWILLDELIEGESIDEDVNANPNYALNADGKELKIKGTETKVNLENMLVTSTGSAINIQGLAASTYYIQELNAPAGYNKLEQDASITIKMELDDKSKFLDKVEFSYNGAPQIYDVDEKNGKIDITIVNYKGNVLPSTGGIGTTIFYTAGGILVAAAVVLMVTKKRMGSKEV